VTYKEARILHAENSKSKGSKNIAEARDRENFSDEGLDNIICKRPFYAQMEGH